MISKERWEQAQRYIADLDKAGIHVEVDKETKTIRTVIDGWNFSDPLPFNDFHVSIYSKVLAAYKAMGFKIESHPIIQQ